MLPRTLIHFPHQAFSKSCHLNALMLVRLALMLIRLPVPEQGACARPHPPSYTHNTAALGAQHGAPPTLHFLPGGRWAGARGAGNQVNVGAHASRCQCLQCYSANGQCGGGGGGQPAARALTLAASNAALHTHIKNFQSTHRIVKGDFLQDMGARRMQ